MPEWLSSWSANPTSILAAIAVIALIWRGGSWTQRIENSLQTLGERIDGGLKTLRDEVRHEQSETRRTLDTLLLQVGGSTPTATRNSPLRLTEFGKQIEASLDPADWAAATAEELRPKTEGLEPFEINALCEEYVRDRLDNEWQRRVARTAYEFGSNKQAVSDVLQIRLRDALLPNSETEATASSSS